MAAIYLLLSLAALGSLTTGNPNSQDPSTISSEDSQLHDVPEHTSDILSGSGDEAEGVAADGDLTKDLLVRVMQQAKQEIENQEKRAKKVRKMDHPKHKGSCKGNFYARIMDRLEPARIQALIRERAAKILAETFGISLSEVAEKIKGHKNLVDDVVETPDKEIKCNCTYRYRSVSGVCNNLVHKSYGAIDTPGQRLLHPAYADGLSLPRVAQDGQPLPNARKVSRTLFQGLDKPSSKVSHMAMIWGQFIDHDTTLGPQPNVECSETDCKGLQGECFSIEIPPDDSAFGDQKCMIVKRDVPVPVPVGEPREQFNARTATIDASMVYGDVQEKFDSLRDKDNKELLILQKNPANTAAKKYSDLLPKMNPGEDFCRNPDQETKPCFRAGDVRPNENSGLASMHTIWAKEHNRIAKTLKEYNKWNKCWTDDVVFFEARKIVASMIQHITYNEFLPLILDPWTRQHYGLILQPQGFFTGYDHTVNPAIIDAFATAAYRFGHSLVQNQLNRFGKKFNPGITPIEMNNFFDVSSLYDVKKGGVDSILRGLAKDQAQDVDGNFAKAVHEELVRFSGDKSDLAAINIQRAREHGNPGYNQYRKLCGLPEAKSFDDFLFYDLMIADQVDKLKEVYDHPDDVDLFVGGLYEKHMPGGLMGNTFSCLLGEQFKRLRVGDRFWYENYSGPGASTRTGTHAYTGFTWQQLQEIRKASLARVVCDHGHPQGTHTMQLRVLERQSCSNAPVECAAIPEVNLAYWRDGGDGLCK